MIDIENAKKVFREYVSNYNLEDGKIALKYNHILRVAEISEKIATELGLSEEDIRLAELIGIFHDIGRFEQVKRFNTFSDKDSINHGEYGVKLLFEDHLIERFNVPKEYYKTIEYAVLNHNRKSIDKNNLSESQYIQCKIIRDSDKLDIFYVLLTDKEINTYGIESLENETFSYEIIREFKEDKCINYANMQTFGDKWIAHMAYVYDFNFKSSYEFMKNKDYINKLYEKVKFKNLDTIKLAKKIVDYANTYVNDRCE